MTLFISALYADDTEDKSNKIINPLWLISEENTGNYIEVGGEVAFIDLKEEKIKILYPILKTNKSITKLNKLKAKEANVDLINEKVFLYGNVKFNNHINSSNYLKGGSDVLVYTEYKDLIYMKGKAIISNKDFSIEAEEIYLDAHTLDIMKSVKPKMKIFKDNGTQGR